jgi:effector-binding domain-containing protein
MLDKPQIVQTDMQLTAVIRLTIPREEIRNVMGPAMAEVTVAVAAQDLLSTGPLFSQRFKMDPDIFDFEVGVPVSTSISPVGRVGPGQLPAAKVARTVYRGPYEGLRDAWREFVDWITGEGHTPAPNL